MRCDRSREELSAGLDGEAAPGRSAELSRHLEVCADCRAWAADSRALHRSLRLGPAPEVPDLTAAILAAVGPAGAPTRRRRWLRRPRLTVPGSALPALRAVLAVVGVSQIVLGAPELLARAAEHGHASRHLGGWDVAFAVGLLVVAVQPWRARGLLPMAAAVGGVMLLNGTVDAVSGGTPGMTEATHVLEICGLALLWAIGRIEAARGEGGGGWRTPLLDRGGWLGRVRGARRSWAGRSVLGQPSVPSVVASSSPSWRRTASRARATRERMVPIGQSHTDAVSA
jgi:predicted anti-sigma-YlaC factor YlaD